MKKSLQAHKISRLIGSFALGLVFLLLIFVSMDKMPLNVDSRTAFGYAQDLATLQADKNTLKNTQDLATLQADKNTLKNTQDMAILQADKNTLKKIQDFATTQKAESIFTEDATIFSVTFIDNNFVVKSSKGDDIYNAATFLEAEVLHAIEAKIGELKDENGKYRYKMDFDKPSVVVKAVDGKNSAPYSELAFNLEYGVEVSHFMPQSNIDYKWFVKTENGEFVLQPSSTENKFYFGQNKAVGKYQIKCESAYNIQFDGLIYGVTAEDVSEGEVSANDTFELGTLPTVKVEYGKFGVVDLSKELADSRGVWEFADTVDRTERLAVGKHDIKVCFTPKNINYSTIFDLKIEFEIVGLPIKIAVENKSSVFGQPHANLTYKLLSKLAYEDEVSDLWITLTKESGEAAGIYNIEGKISNGSYIATFVNEDDIKSEWNVGGDYTILRDEIKCQWQNHALFSVKFLKGFSQSAELKMVQIDGGLPIDLGFGVYSVGRIKLFAMDKDGVINFDDEFVLEISNIIDGATSVLYFDGVDWQKKDVVNGRVEINVPSLGEICFVVETVEEAPSDWNAATIVLACVIGLLIGAIVVLKKKFGGKN